MRSLYTMLSTLIKVFCSKFIIMGMYRMIFKY